MARKFSKRITRKTRVKLSPQQASNIIEEEFADTRGNKFRFRITGKPHKPNKPTIEREIQYNDRNDDN